jgi:hypothetical protein
MPSNPSAAAGWAKIASRSTEYDKPPSIAVWTTAIISLTSAPNVAAAEFQQQDWPLLRLRHDP